MGSLGKKLWPGGGGPTWGGGGRGLCHWALLFTKEGCCDTERDPEERAPKHEDLLHHVPLSMTMGMLGNMPVQRRIWRWYGDIVVASAQ